MKQEPKITLDHIAQCRERALAAGALMPMEAQNHALEENGLPYEARWISTLSLKIMAKSLEAAGKVQKNPFLPYEQDLYVADLSESHVMIFNKFGISKDHLLAITRRFEPQEEILNSEDFNAVAPILTDLGGLLMFNGGSAAGASQPHKHFHLMPHREVPLDDHFCTLVKERRLTKVPEFQFVHALTALDLKPEMSAEEKSGMLQDAYQACLAACQLSPEEGGATMPAYNILASSKWFLVVPRSRTAWVDGDARVHVHSMTFGGEVGVANEEQIEVVKRVGFLRILEATTLPVKAC